LRIVFNQNLEFKKVLGKNREKFRKRCPIVGKVNGSREGTNKGGKDGIGAITGKREKKGCE